jgi:hypothetical protein
MFEFSEQEETDRTHNICTQGNTGSERLEFRGSSFSRARFAIRMHLRKESSTGLLTAFLLTALFNSLAPGKETLSYGN